MDELKRNISKLDDKQFFVAARDLLSAPVEVIVNPANSQLAHGGGLAAAIEQAAGADFTLESDDYITQHGPVPTTKTAVTGAGRLPYQYVIHAVGPIMGSGEESKKLSQTVVNVLTAAERLSIKSIALPAISSGIYHVPLETSIRATIKAVHWYWGKRPHSCINTVWLCLTNSNYNSFAQFYDNG